MNYKKIANPCRLFSALSLIHIIDPLDGREKIAFVSISQGDKGALVIADYYNKQFEVFPMIKDAGAWALIQHSDGSLLLGTCNYYGSLQRFDMKKREWYPLLRVESEIYIWNLVQGSDGNYYGGTWPGDKLLKYCPDTHTLHDLGKVSNDPGNNYSRMVYAGVPGKIYINSVFASKTVTAYDLATGTFQQNFGGRACGVYMLCEDFVCTTDEESYELLDPYTGKKLINESIPVGELEKYSEKYELVKRLKKHIDEDIKLFLKEVYGEGYSALATYMHNGDLVGIQAQEMFLIKKGERSCHYIDIDAEPPKAFIHELICDAQGMIWGASSFGMTIFNFNPKTGEYKNTKSISKLGGEVYGMVAKDGKIYNTAYAGGEHIVYDPAKPWAVRENINPHTIKTLGPSYIRPYTKSKLDKQGNIWTGWLAEYGKRGQAISKWNTADDSITLYKNLVPQTGIFGLDISEDYIWFTTCNHANGLPDISDPLSLCAMDYDGNLVFRKTFEHGVRVGRVAFSGRYGLVQVGELLHQIDSVRMEVEPITTVKLKRFEDGIVETLLAVDADTIAVFDIDETIFIKPETGEVTATVASPKGNEKELFYHGIYAATLCEGKLYASVGTDLYVLEGYDKGAQS